MPVSGGMLGPIPARLRSLRPGGKGIRKVQKVRLLHAALRHLISRSDRWDAGVWGTPINQEALFGTLLSFSVIVARSLPALGVRVRPQEAGDYLYAWLVIGEMLARRNHCHSEDGVLMTRALLELMADSLPRRFEAAPAALMRYMARDDLLVLPARDPDAPGEE